MFKIIKLFILFILFNSCTPTLIPISLKSREYTNVELNSQLKKEIGDILIEKGFEGFQEALKISNITEFKINTLQFPYANGDVLPLSGKTKEWLLFYKNVDSMKDMYNQKINNSNYIFGIARNIKNDKLIAPFLFYDQGGIGSIVFKEIKDLEVEKVDYKSDCKECFKKEFIYNGKVDNNLKFIYREYIENMVRPSFTQELQYDLNESNIIGFKGLRLEIIKATNTILDYKVLNSFN